MSEAVEQTPSGFWRTIKAVAWAFLGLRGRRGFEQDTQQVNPLHLVVVGLLGVFVFVGALIALVNWMVT